MTSEILAKIGFVLELKQKLKEKNEKKNKTQQELGMV